MVKPLLLQWHISEKCNLKCTHCYQENHKPFELDYDKLISILGQYKILLKNKKVRGHINITGGEPLMNPYFFPLLEYMSKDKELYSFSILTNGTLIDDKIAEKISYYKPNYVQVSIEGNKKANDKIRGKKTYKKVASAIKNLRKHNIFVSLSFTATNQNYKQFPSVVKYALKYNVNAVWSDRLIPIGDKDIAKLCMNNNEFKDFLEIMNNQRLLMLKKKKKLDITMNRALQFIFTDKEPYCCSAGDTLLTVMENGDLVPCRRMPIVIGNLLKTDILTLYNTDKTLKKLQQKEIPKECESCDHCGFCRGGLKCLSFALTNDLDRKDVNCFL